MPFEYSIVPIAPSQTSTRLSMASRNGTRRMTKNRPRPPGGSFGVLLCPSVFFCGQKSFCMVCVFLYGLCFSLTTSVFDIVLHGSRVNQQVRPRHKIEPDGAHAVHVLLREPVVVPEEMQPWLQ